MLTLAKISKILDFFLFLKVLRKGYFGAKFKLPIVSLPKVSLEVGEVILTALSPIQRTSIKKRIQNRVKCYLSSLCKKNLSRVILAQLNVNSIQNKFNLLAEGIKGNVDVLMMSETKLDETFPSRQFYTEGLIYTTLQA